MKPENEKLETPQDELTEQEPRPEEPQATGDEQSTESSDVADDGTVDGEASDGELDEADIESQLDDIVETAEAVGAEDAAEGAEFADPEEDIDPIPEVEQAGEIDELADNVVAGAEAETTDAEEAVGDTEAIDEEVDGDDASDADVTYENGRPLVQELQYQAPKGKPAAATEDEESVEVKFSSVSEAKAVVEGFLFSCNEPLSVSKISKLMGNLHPKTVRGLLLELQWEYENRPGGLQVVEIAGGYQMSTRAFVAPWMFRMHKHKRRSALSPATLETLAIIAYRQPITKGEIEGIRGVESGAPLRTLQELNLVEASGRREVIGRPQLYVTTEQFLKTFGLKSVGDLPSISELKARYTEEQKLKPVVAAAPEKRDDETQQAEPEDAELESVDAADAADDDAILGEEVADNADEDADADADADELENELEDSEDSELDADVESDLEPDDSAEDAEASDDIDEDGEADYEDLEKD